MPVSHYIHTTDENLSNISLCQYFAGSANSQSYNIVAISILWYLVNNTMTFDFLYITQLYLKAPLLSPDTGLLEKEKLAVVEKGAIRYQR